MRRYFLATAMLALGAVGVVWIAIKEQAAAKAAKAKATASTAIAEPSASGGGGLAVNVPASAAGAAAPTAASASATPTADMQVGDAGQTLPPLAAYAAWSVVRWGMSASEVEVALRQAGVIVVDAADPKASAKPLRAKSGAWDVTIDLGSGSSSQIVVTAANLSKEEAQAAVLKIKARAPATNTIERTERRWKKDAGAVATFVTHVEGTTATMREEHVRERSPGGALGFASLRWGMSAQEVVGLLTAGGYAARAPKSPAETVPLPFSKGGVEGMASFNQFGLRHVEISGPTVDGGAARAKELESSLGKPASAETSTKTQHADHARMTSIDVEVTERQPGGAFTVVETYRPKN